MCECQNKAAKLSLATIAAQAGNHEDERGAVALPIYLSSNYRHPTLKEAINFDAAKDYTYSRLSTPNRRAVEKTLAKLEGGTAAFAVSSGMAAVQLALSILKTGDRLISLDDLYGGDFRYFDYLNRHAGIEFDQWDGGSLAELVAKLTPKTRIVWLETPSNPTMKEIDIQAVAAAVHEYDPQIKVIVDNTFYTPIYQRPLLKGADVVIHSATKYLSGHNDLLGGAVIVRMKNWLRRTTTTTLRLAIPWIHLTPGCFCEVLRRLRCAWLSTLKMPRPSLSILSRRQKSKKCFTQVRAV